MFEHFVAVGMMSASATTEGIKMKGFDLYEQWRSCVFEVSGFTERSWDALEIWERRAWEEMDDRYIERKGLAEYVREHRNDPDSEFFESGYEGR